jgi:hypothetical protein
MERTLSGFFQGRKSAKNDGTFAVPVVDLEHLRSGYILG